MDMIFKPIGYVRTDTPDADIPRHWSVSEVEGMLELLPEYQQGLVDIQAGESIVLLFHFDRSQEFTADLLIQNPPHHKGSKGVFSICSPRRPNPIGLSVLAVTDVQGRRIHVKGLDIYNGTPILDIKPHVPVPNR